jgi:hypothetical protein
MAAGIESNKHKTPIRIIPPAIPRTPETTLVTSVAIITMANSIGRSRSDRSAVYVMANR